MANNLVIWQVDWRQTFSHFIHYWQLKELHSIATYCTCTVLIAGVPFTYSTYLEKVKPDKHKSDKASPFLSKKESRWQAGWCSMHWENLFHLKFQWNHLYCKLQTTWGAASLIPERSLHLVAAPASMAVRVHYFPVPLHHTIAQLPPEPPHCPLIMQATYLQELVKKARQQTKEISFVIDWWMITENIGWNNRCPMGRTPINLFEDWLTRSI